MRNKLVKGLLAASAVVAVVGTANTSDAGVISIKAENFGNATDAWNAMQDYRNGQKAFVDEDFDGIAPGTLTESFVGGLSTDVGRFMKGAGALDGTGACGDTPQSDCTSPGILSSLTTPFSGRFNSTDGDSADPNQNWLDSNDVTQVVWEVDLAGDNIDFGPHKKITSLGVILTDVTDVGAEFELTVAGGGSMKTSDVFSGLGNGTYTFVTAHFQGFIPPITGFKATFENSNGVTGDGFGIDDATISVPVPSTLALMGAGLVMAGFASRMRRRAA